MEKLRILPGNSAVAVIFYNRPNTLRQLLEVLSEIRPEEVVYISDGPRDEESRVLVEECRKLVAQSDWGAERTFYYSKKNSGMYSHVPDALGKAFKKYEGLLIFEDDCIPDPRLFAYVKSISDAHDQDPLLAGICGHNPIGSTPFLGSKSYSLSRIMRGWGTWRTRFHWDRFMEFYESQPTAPTIPWSTCLEHIFYTPGLLRKIIKAKVVLGNRKNTGPADIWYNIYMQKRGLYVALPKINLVSNIGSGPSATHTKTLPSIKLKSRKPVDFAATTRRQTKVIKRVEVIEGYLIGIWLALRTLKIIK